MRKLFSCIAIIFILIMVPAKLCMAQNAITIALDPGHGGQESGASYYGTDEKDINLKMAQLVKQGLESYPGVNVVLTRDDDEDMNLYDRAAVASRANANVLISLHFNASSSHKGNGASVYISTSEYRKKQMDLADYFLGEFENLGLENAGTFARTTQMGYRRADGSFEDYYGVIRNAYNMGMPGLIVEHCYIDSEVDYKYWSEDAALKRLANADVNAIAAYYQLQDENGDIYEGKHAKGYGRTTSGCELDCDTAPQITNVSMIEVANTTPAVVRYSVEVEDQVGVTSIYFIYKDLSTGESFTISTYLDEPLKTGTYELMGFVPSNVALGSYQLMYIGAYNRAGYDVGYNKSGNTYIGFGKCDWQNQFTVPSSLSLTIDQTGTIDKKNWDVILRDISKRMMH